MGADYVLEKLPDVSEPSLVEVGRYRMVSEPTLAVSWARVSQLRRHGVHDWCGPRVVTQHGTCAGTGCTDVAKRGRSWLVVDRRERRSLKGVKDVTPGTGLNRINMRLIPTSCNFFSGSPSPKNSKVKRAWSREI